MEIDKFGVMCDGQDENSALVHPRIYLYIQENNKISCPYCSKEFVYEPSGN